MSKALQENEKKEASKNGHENDLGGWGFEEEDRDAE